jgi:hypothetical protein
MIYDIFYVSKNTIDDTDWLSFNKRFPLSQKIENIKNFSDIVNRAFTKLFWVVWDDIIVLDDFDFSYIVTKWDEKYIHVFKNADHYDGVTLFSKHSNVSNKELEKRFYINHKKIDIIASEPKNTELYDIVFISYNEPTADVNFINLKSKFPRTKRVHGIKGIHQAHIAAAKLAKTCMFWVVDGDAEIVEDFNFDYKVSAYEQDIVYVWRSKNPINDLVYGYGGVKLLPTSMTIGMDVSKPDMTTSISSKFRAVKSISNITAFNTDPFNTWKSAFRECCKLSSKIIDRQKSEETLHRLDVWCTLGSDRPFGQEAIAGAIAGKEYGEFNKDDLEALKKINDFDWLKEYYEQQTKNRS